MLLESERYVLDCMDSEDSGVASMLLELSVIVFDVTTIVDEFGLEYILSEVVGTTLESGKMDWDVGVVDVLPATCGVELDVVATRNEVALATVLSGGDSEVKVLDLEMTLEVNWRMEDEILNSSLEELIVEVIKLLVEVIRKLSEAVAPLLDVVTMVVEDRSSRPLDNVLVATAEVEPAKVDNDRFVLPSDAVDGVVLIWLPEYAELGVLPMEDTGAVP
ncbi:hypothetical protein VPNG_07176 [Cytospora leucostoma]|uniref:Uncharacterized protein n=1 Tax=Cytospora leucostoma TaxID=1230097 RepID=A0A423WJI9_9PEZI|nr:hypothetical protein VPNG_07176 [Cytospora leucostoma]